MGGSASTPELETVRLQLRPWRLDEAERLLDIRSRPEVAKWLGSSEPWRSVETAHAAITEWLELTGSPDPLGVWAIVPHDARRPAGTVSLRTIPESDEVEIGWNLHPDSSGRGYAREAAAAILGRGLSNGVPRIWAIMWPENLPSARVARAIGMDDLGVIDDPWYGSAEYPLSQMFRRDASVD